MDAESHSAPLRVAELSDAQKRDLLASMLRDVRAKPQLSVTQERIWQLDQLAPGNAAYNFQGAIELGGRLDAVCFRRSLACVVARHETLRTRYASAQGAPKLEVLDALEAAVDMLDCSALDGASQAARVQAIAQRAAQAGFTLDAPPLFRLQCVQLAETRHVLVLTMHHIVSDLLSIDLFFEALGRHYAAILAGADGADEAPLAWTYLDHARAERAGRTALREGPAAAFWRGHLHNAPELDWHADLPRPQRRSGKATTQHFVLGAETVRDVEALARANRVTPFVVLMAAFLVLQQAASGSDDQLVAVPTAGRARDEVQGLIGMFSSPLPMRVALGGATDLTALLGCVRDTVLGVTEHAALPFADIVETAQEDAGRPLVLRSMFSFVSRVRPLAFADLDAKRVPTERGISDFDLFLTVYPDAGAWRGVFEFAADLFGTGTARGFADAYAAIVRAMAAACDETAVPPTLASLAALVPLPRRVEIAVAATFTADALDDAVSLWSRELRWPARLRLAPYHQVFQSLVDPASVLHDAGNALAALLVRPHDWLRDAAERSAGMLDAIVGEFVSVVRSARLRAPLVIYLCPTPPGASDAEAHAAEKRIEAELTGLAGVTVRRAEAALVGYALRDVHDAQADAIGHIPYTRAWFASMGTELVRRASSRLRAPTKVLALDCDQTLWHGVAAEDGARGVAVDAAHRALQAFALAQADAGVLLCLVSKNEPEDVWRVFDGHPDMLLERDRIVAHRINWQPKSANLRALADELQLGLDSFVFIDDNPVECAEVRAACPEVLTLCLPRDAQAIPAFLANVWAFDRDHVSVEDRQRAESVRQNRQRDTLRREHASLGEFMARLELKVDLDVAAADAASVPRLAQLSQRTNQFNNAGQRWDDVELRGAIRADLLAHAVTVRDRFGDYGLVGFAASRVGAGVLRVESFLLSCRVLGRGVEHRMLAELGAVARAHGASSVQIEFRELPRNQPFRRFLAGLPGGFDADGRRFRLSADAAAAVRFDPDAGADARDATVDAPAPAIAPAPTATDVHAARQAALATIAETLRDADAIVAHLDADRPPRRTSAGGGLPPQGATEQTIAAVWQDVLRVDAPGRDDNFFEIGGNSLRLVEVDTKLMARLGREIPIVSLFQFPTIASLAHHLDHQDESAAQRTQVQARAGQARQQLAQRMQRLAELRRP